MLEGKGGGNFLVNSLSQGKEVNNTALFLNLETSFMGVIRCGWNIDLAFFALVASHP